MLFGQEVNIYKNPFPKSNPRETLLECYVWTQTNPNPAQKGQDERMVQQGQVTFWRPKFISHQPSVLDSFNHACSLSSFQVLYFI